MKSKDLLSQLSRMEQSLHDFSYEELTSKEAADLKTTFEAFKKNLEIKLFQPSASNTFEQPNAFIEESRSQNLADSSHIDPKMLIARVSHEIRTPLNGIIGFTDLLREDNKLNEGQLDHVKAIHKASYSLMEIINELLEYSKLSAGVETFELVDFNFRNVIGDVVYLCKTLVSDKDVALNVTIDDNIPAVLLGDPSKLSQVLLNLVGNAIKFVEKGSIDVVIKAKSLKKNRTYLTFTITDTGIGISEDNLKHIFDSFKQAETNTYMKYGGSGLGLSIVKQIIEQLGGGIKVRSELGVGTTFDFSIPYENGDADGLAKEDLAPFQISEKEMELTRDMRILIFEDNLLNQRLIEQRLQGWKCKTFITEDAQYGLNILSKHKIDLILMDLKMPGMNGFEVTELIRGFEKPGCKSIPIIALSGDFSALDEEKYKESGIDDFIMKPYSPQELLQKILESKSGTAKKDNKKPKPIESKPSREGRLAVDLSGLLEECMGQMELLQELLFLYKQNTLEFIGQVHIHLQNSDFEQIGFSAHKIKSGLKMMQSQSLLNIVEQIQKCCLSEPDRKHLQFLYASFLEEYPKTEQVLDSAMEELRKSEG